MAHHGGVGEQRVGPPVLSAVQLQQQQQQQYETLTVKQEYGSTVTTAGPSMPPCRSAPGPSAAAPAVLVCQCRGVPPTVFRDYFVHLYLDCSAGMRPPPPGRSGKRLYIADEVLYPGNSKKFKRWPDEHDEAVMLSVQVYDPATMELTPACDECVKFVERRNYFRSNPSCRGRIVLVKSFKDPVPLDNPSSVPVVLRVMCAAHHHEIPFFLLRFSFRDWSTGRILFYKDVHLNVREWRRGKPDVDNVHLAV